MKLKSIYYLLLISLVLFTLSPDVSANEKGQDPSTGIIRVYNTVLHEIDPKIYGHFIEELGEQIHDGIWVYSKRLKKQQMVEDPRINRIRKDLFDAVHDMVQAKENGKTILRWPGGNFAESYFWKRGIGPREKRPLNTNEYWAKSSLQKGTLYNSIKNVLIYMMDSPYGVCGPDHDNQFGTDEFLVFCEKLGVEPYINVNYGSGTPQDATDWVEYCNGGLDTKWGKKRAKNGHPEPYNVKFWGIGNEIWGKWTIGHENAVNSYAKKYNLYAKQMKERDPTIKLVASGIDRLQTSRLYSKETRIWNQALLPLIKDNVDFLSEHLYLGLAPGYKFLKEPENKSAETEDEYYSVMGSPIMYQEMIDRGREDIEKALGKDTQVKLLIDEWNLWFSASQLIKANHPLADGLWTASVLHVLQKNSPICPINNFSMMVNTFGLIRTDDKGIVKTPSYHSMMLFSKYAKANYLKTLITSDTFTSKSFRNMTAQNGILYLDGNATGSTDGRELTITVINKHLKESISGTIEFSGFENQLLQVSEIIQMTHGQNPMTAYNTPDNRKNVIPKHLPLDAYRENWFEFPPHSLTVLTFEVK